jgi:hypothetical protein
VTNQVFCRSLLLFALLAHGCGTKIAQTATQPAAVHNGDGGEVTGPASCGATLASRLQTTTVDVEDDIRYKREGYDNVLTDARLAFSVAPSGNSYVAWTNNGFNTVYVTPLTALQTRFGPDIPNAGYDIAGLVAQDDGFALLLNREDPGTPLVNPNPTDKPYGKAAVAVRVRQGKVVFAAPLTGTAHVVADAGSPPHDCTPERFDGRLAHLGGKYGAYFTVHGCQGDAHESYYADKLAYFDDQGQPVSGGWNWGCQIDEDLRLLPETGPFTALCMTDDFASGGLNLNHEGSNLLTRLASEFVSRNVCAGQFGSIVKLADNSYVVVWLSRGGSNADDSSPAKPANDIALIRLSAAPAYTPSAITWITNTPNVHEMNLHAAAYGPSRLLLAWDSVENFDCSQFPLNVTCLGDYTGTHFVLIDTQGNQLTADELLPAPPNSRDDLTLFPNGDVGWAFVPDAARNYNSTLEPQKIPQLVTKRQISIARLLYCP